MTFDAFLHQLPDADAAETGEWLESLDALVASEGAVRARFVIGKLLERARRLQVPVPSLVSTPYINTIPPDEEPWFPGDEEMERRIRRIVRWNAAAMVTRANKRSDGIGGHLSTYASAASLYEVGFNHFFRGKDDGNAGDQIYYQGHAAPGMYSHAYLEGRITETQMDNFRQETGGNGLSSYPHPRLMPDFWEFPTVSMGLGPLNAIYQARFNRYLQNRGLLDTSGSRVWAFLGDGETIFQGRNDLRWRNVALVVAAERRHHADPRHLDAVFEVQRGLLLHRLDILGVAAVQVFLGEALRRGQRDRAGDRQLVAEHERPVEPARVEPQRGVVDAFLRGEPGDDVFGVGPTRDDARADEGGGLDMVQSGFGERLDQLDLVGGADRAGLDLEPFPRAFLMDVHMCRQIGHDHVPR